MSQVHDHCDARFSKLRTLMQDFIASGQDIGASLCVNVGGSDNAVDIWGGYADPVTKKPWEKDTIINVFSTTKLVTNLVALMLISRGLLAPDDTVAQHWPEFAVNGKAAIIIKQVLTHTAGLNAWQDNVTLQDACNSKLATYKLADQAPLWPPGTATGYHSLTQGFLVGELLRRKTGMSMDQSVSEQIYRPLGDANFQLGCHEQD